MYKNYKEQFAGELKEIKESRMWKEEGVLEGKQGTTITIKDNNNDKRTP